MPLSQEEIEKLHIIVKNAGDILMGFYQTQLDRYHKEDGSFATQADHASEKYLIEELSKMIPGAGFYTEETGIIDGTSEYSWVIDPLDGTTNFAAGIPYFCVSVALTCHNEPVVGCIYNPMTRELFYAEKGKGAYCNGNRLAASNIKESKRAILAIECAEEDFAVVTSVWDFSSSIRLCGASALDIAYCAAGRYDAVILTQFKWWDIAAGIILIKEAHGFIVTFEDKVPDFSSKSIVAGNLFLVDQYLELIKDVNSI